MHSGGIALLSNGQNESESEFIVGFSLFSPLILPQSCLTFVKFFAASFMATQNMWKIISSLVSTA